MESYRNIIIGSGYAGKAMAWHLAKQGESTICIERSHLGGACPNVAWPPRDWHVSHDNDLYALYARDI